MYLRKSLAESGLQESLNLRDAKLHLSQQYFFKPVKVLNKENRASNTKYDFWVSGELIFQSAFIWSQI